MAEDKLYQLIDSGNRLKLEKFGPFRLIRPQGNALWHPSMDKSVWDDYDACFTRNDKWEYKKKMGDWVVELEGLCFKIKMTDFGHLGLFPEHANIWKWVREKVNGKKIRLLNLFAYSGGVSLAAAQAGCEVCHVDASAPTVQWARENAALNGLEKAPVRWIVEDVIRFLKREERRGSLYDAIVLDPPSFGRGNRNEVFKLEKDIEDLLSTSKKLLTKDPLFVVFTSHTPGLTPLVLGNLLKEYFGKSFSGELAIHSKSSFDLPNGSFARWESGNNKQ